MESHAGPTEAWTKQDRGGKAPCCAGKNPLENPCGKIYSAAIRPSRMSGHPWRWIDSFIGFVHPTGLTLWAFTVI